jgi:hypothetical protein
MPCRSVLDHDNAIVAAGVFPFPFHPPHTSIATLPESAL